MRECAEKLESKDGRGKEQDDQEGLRAGSGDGRCGRCTTDELEREWRMRGWQWAAECVDKLEWEEGWSNG